MSLVAQYTNGEYLHVKVGDDVLKLRDAFTQSRTSFRWNSELHLVRNNISPESRTIFRNMLRTLFIILWSAFSGIMIVVFLNNTLLIKHFLIPKIVVAVICGIAFTIIFMMFDTEGGGRMARALLAANMCLIYVPTYGWD
jgi:hypothetical protein